MTTIPPLEVVSADELLVFERPSVWRRLRKDRWAVAAFLVLVALSVMAMLAPLLAPYDPAEQDLLSKLQGPEQSTGWEPTNSVVIS